MPLPEPEPVAEQPQPRPQRRPEPPREPPKPAFDPSSIAALLDKIPEEAEPQRRQPEWQAPAQPTRTASRMTVSEIDAFRMQMSRCWSPPVGAANAGQLVVRIRIFLLPNGQLAQAPQLLNSRSGDRYFEAAAGAAMRAIQRCQPYRMPADKYQAWQQIDLNFDPSEMLGG